MDDNCKVCTAYNPGQKPWSNYTEDDQKNDSRDKNKAAIKTDNINNYSCIFQSLFPNFGKSYNADILLSSNGTYSCDDHKTCIQNMVTIQSQCNGHKLKSSDCRGKLLEFPIIQKNKTINNEFLNQLADILNEQITERKQSNIYKSKINPVNDINYNTKENKIHYGTTIGEIVNALTAIQTDSHHDTAIIPNNTFDDVKQLKVVSKKSVDNVIKYIKKDINDCICYSDCNGYAVCFCYGNCNHY